MPPLLHITTLDNELVVAILGLAGLVTQGGLAPRGNRTGAAHGGLALTTAVGVVAGVHDGTANGGTPAHVTLAAGLTDLDVLMLQVAHLTDAGGAVGADGTLSVVKDLGLKEPYVGVVPLVSGEIAEDIAQYFATSEQTPTVCGLGVLVKPDLTVQVAGGYLIQVLPFASDACIDTIENNLKTLPPMTKMMTEGMTPDQIALRLLDGLEPNLLDEAEVAYHCDCSRERTERMLLSLGAKELQSLEEEQKTIEVCCHFCGKKYCFTPEEIRSLRLSSEAETRNA